MLCSFHLLFTFFRIVIIGALLFTLWTKRATLGRRAANPLDQLMAAFDMRVQSEAKAEGMHRISGFPCHVHRKVRLRAHRREPAHHPDWAVPALPLLLRKEDPDEQTLTLLPSLSSSRSLSITTQTGLEDEGWHAKKVGHRASGEGSVPMMAQLLAQGNGCVVQAMSGDLRTLSIDRRNSQLLGLRTVPPVLANRPRGWSQSGRILSEAPVVSVLSMFTEVLGNSVEAAATL